MKRTSPLWGSISILIGVVIAILSLLRGIWATVALIAVFAVWGLWLIFTQLLPAWRSNRTYRRRVRQSRDRQEATSDTSDSGMGLVLLRHVNHRISEHLRSVYPQAHWEWTLADPTRFIAYGGTGRIRVYGIPDYDYADVTLDRQGGLRCSLVKVELHIHLEGNVPPETVQALDDYVRRGELQGIVEDAVENAQRETARRAYT